jgi:hypothetical protein
LWRNFSHTRKRWKRGRRRKRKSKVG